MGFRSINMNDNKKLSKKMDFAKPQAGKKTKGNVPRLVIFKSPRDGQYYFHLMAANSKVIFQSEGYKQLAGAKKGLKAIQSAFYNAVIVLK